jgi:hypothetical protein
MESAAFSNNVRARIKKFHQIHFFFNQIHEVGRQGKGAVL